MTRFPDDSLTLGLRKWSWILPLVIAIISGGFGSYIFVREQLSSQDIKISNLEKDIEKHIISNAHSNDLPLIEADRSIFAIHADADAKMFSELQRRMDRAEDRLLTLEREHTELGRKKTGGNLQAIKPPSIAERVHE